MDMELGSKKEALMQLIKKMHELIAKGEYGADEEMSSGDMGDVMGEVEDEMSDSMDMPSPDMDEDIGDEVSEFMKGKNLGKRPKMKAVFGEVSVKSPPKKDIGKSGGYSKGKKGNKKSFFGGRK